jgi:hypothetical protein
MQSIVDNIGVVDHEQVPLQGEELEQHLSNFGMEVCFVCRSPWLLAGAEHGRSSHIKTYTPN